MDQERWGRRIKAYRKLKGYTQVEFSDAIGVSLSIVGEIERGKRKPTKEFLERTVETLGVPLVELEPPHEK
ncbi:helix-turn-helix domain-containing protein [Amphibacillus xylanus]|uniref:Putative DNA-binding protein n=1 Tax=Amphibacillus xylanus (strain ATCC 51415 / DSM 6626 / JCM 7361 / LMG 17667 / NBRC 15112 / Ep01) TaxID=698758 RepID=K0IZ20_AMPXN|nr:helix-turn-helix transcriptional regulator [Amphibacillus xylanus]BAM46222.1 putative DNA-binding protein [Amphibacillus xylanus NBRC 15112]